MRTTARPFLRRLLVVLALSAAALGLVLFIPTVAPAHDDDHHHAVLQWTPPSLRVVIAPGHDQTLSVSLKASKTLRDVRIRPSGRLGRFISVEPSRFERIKRGQTVSLTITFSAPAHSPLGTVKGSVTAKSDDDALEERLPVVVENWQSVEGPSGVSLAAPPAWHVALPEQGGPLAMDNFGGVYEQGGIRPPEGAEIDATTMPLSGLLNELIAQELQGTTIESTTTRPVGGEPATRVAYLAEYTPMFSDRGVAVYVPRNGVVHKFYLFYALGNPQETELLTTFEHVLDLVEFTP